MSKFSITIPAAAIFVALLPTAAGAATKTATFNVTATVVDDCTISADHLDFGDVGILSSNVDADANIRVLCTQGTDYTIALDAGSGTGSTIQDRHMANGTDTLKYQMYRDAARVQVWGDNPGTDTEGGEGNGNEQVLTIYGRVPVQPAPAPGSYISTVTATITY
jgi:spore coat protein U-like protein